MIELRNVQCIKLFMYLCACVCVWEIPLSTDTEELMSYFFE